MSENKPCPFCGQAEMLVLCDVGDDDVFWQMVCGSCQARGPYVTDVEDQERAAIFAWNERVVLPKSINSKAEE